MVKAKHLVGIDILAQNIWWKLTKCVQNIWRSHRKIVIFVLYINDYGEEYNIVQAQDV